jgi:hypothetical protein
MFKRASFVLLGLVALALPLFGQSISSDIADSLRTLDRSDLLAPVDSVSLMSDLPTLALLDASALPTSNDLARMGATPANLFPTAFLTASDAPKKISHQPQRELFENEAELKPVHSYEIHGEVGVLYGVSAGKYGGSAFESYLTSTITTDKVSLSVGASYEESSSRFPRGSWLAR